MWVGRLIPVDSFDSSFQGVDPIWLRSDYTLLPHLPFPIATALALDIELIRLGPSDKRKVSRSRCFSWLRRWLFEGDKAAPLALSGRHKNCLIGCTVSDNLT